MLAVILFWNSDFMPKISSKTRGILYVLTAAFGFSVMSLFVKLAGDLPPFQKAFFRNFIALIFILVIMLKNKVGFIPQKKAVPSLFGRCFFGTVGLLCNFYAISKMNLSDANMLNKLSPFFAIIFSVFLLKEKPKLVQIIGVCTAFAGSKFIIKPSFDNPELMPALFGVLGGFGAGTAYTFVRKLGTMKENSNRIVFYCLMCVPFIIFDYEPMSAKQLIYLVLAGTFACIGQLGITRAYMCAPAKEISVYDYSQVVFAAVLGFLVFGDVPDLLSVAGYILICGAGIAMFFYNKKHA